MRCAVELHAIELRATELQAFELCATKLRASELCAVGLRAVELCQLATKLLRAAKLCLRAVQLRDDVLCMDEGDDAPPKRCRDSQLRSWLRCTTDDQARKHRAWRRVRVWRASERQRAVDMRALVLLATSQHATCAPLYAQSTVQLQSPTSRKLQACDSKLSLNGCRYECPINSVILSQVRVERR